jgi:hypothetical protein
MYQPVVIAIEIPELCKLLTNPHVSAAEIQEADPPCQHSESARSQWSAIQYCVDPGAAMEASRTNNNKLWKSHNL